MLPTNGAPWPPPHIAPVLADVREHDVWYSADPDRIRSFYDSYQDTGGMLTRRPRFWGRASSITGRESPTRMHVPVASDICTLSADLLFSEAPTFAFETPTVEARWETLTDPTNGIDLHTLLLAAGETSAALGGTYWRLSWDLDISELPLLAFADPDSAYGEWSWGRLQAVLFWRVLPAQGESRVVWRHIERHTPGRVEHALYAGDDGRIGNRVPLIEHPGTAPLAESLTDQDYLDLPEGLMTAGAVPNVLPNRRRRGSMSGRSDLDGLADLFDAIDEVWTSLVRDFRLGKTRVMVPSEYLRVAGAGRGASFDFDRELYQPLNIPPTGGAGGATIEVSQPLIRVAEHEQALRLLIAQAVASAGYSPGSFGLSDGGVAVTATEIKARERRSMVTSAKKARYWTVEIQRIATAMLRLDAFLNPGVGVADPGRVGVEFADSVADDPRATAETVEILTRAQAMSVETKIRTLHPDWEETQVMAEVAAIMGETGMVVADPTRIGGEDETDPGLTFATGG